MNSELIPLRQLLSYEIDIFMEQTNLENDGRSFFGGGAS